LTLGFSGASEAASRNIREPSYRGSVSDCGELYIIGDGPQLDRWLQALQHDPPTERLSGSFPHRPLRCSTLTLKNVGC